MIARSVFMPDGTAVYYQALLSIQVPSHVNVYIKMSLIS